MEYIAIAKNIKTSPRKMRLVVDGVKNKKLEAALASLIVLNKRASGPLAKAINSAVSNATNNFAADKRDLVIRDIIVTDGPKMKRFHFAGRGRTRPYVRRQSHVRVILADSRVAGQKAPVVATAAPEPKVTETKVVEADLKVKKTRSKKEEAK